MTDTVCNENVQFNKLKFEISAVTEARWLLNNAFFDEINVKIVTRERTINLT